MSDLPISRRSLLKATGVGLLAASGVSSMGNVAAHGSIHASAEDLLTPRLIPSNPDFGFNYPYYLYAPEPISDDPRPVLIEPNNTGTTTDDFDRHRSNAQGIVSGGFSRTLSEALRVPLLVPAFPRPKSEPADWRHYVHSLDVDTMEESSGPLERVDLQLLKMAEHARKILANYDYPLNDQTILNGFSASGNFVNRFTALHPDKVQSVSAGGINGTAILPIAEDKGHTLNYHIGIADMESLTGEPFDLEAFKEVSQLLYMGGEDENDTIPYDDAWSDEQREIALDVYGDDMQEDRMPYCESVYDEVGCDAEFKVYEGVGHSFSKDIQKDILELHQQELAISRIRLTETPTVSSSTVSVDVNAFQTGGISSFEIRVFSDDRGEITADPVALQAGGEFEGEVDLDSNPQAGERITAALLEAGVSDQDQAIATDSETLVDEYKLRIVSGPNPGTSELVIEYAIPADYQADTPIHLFLLKDDQNHTLGLFNPGEAGEKSFNVDDSVDGVPFEEGDSVELALRDVDTGEDLATAQTVVESPGQGEGTGASVDFAVQPIFEETQVTIDYSLDQEYEVQEGVRLELSIGSSSTMLLDFLDPGDSATKSHRFDKLPLEAGETLAATVRDDNTLASATTLVLVKRDSDDDCDENHGTPTPKFTTTPTNPTAGDVVEFDASGSTSPNGEIINYAWEFGDGETAVGERVTHEFDPSGEYMVTLEVIDEVGVEQSTTAQLTIQVADSGAPDEPVKSTFEGPPQDLDGDGKHEDINGDGRFDIGDVQGLFTNRDSQEVRDHAASYDFNDDGIFSIADIQRLFELFKSG